MVKLVWLKKPQPLKNNFISYYTTMAWRLIWPGSARWAKWTMSGLKKKVWMRPLWVTKTASQSKPVMIKKQPKPF